MINCKKYLENKNDINLKDCNTKTVKNLIQINKNINNGHLMKYCNINILLTVLETVAITLICAPLHKQHYSLYCCRTDTLSASLLWLYLSDR